MARHLTPESLVLLLRGGSPELPVYLHGHLQIKVLRFLLGHPRPTGLPQAAAAATEALLGRWGKPLIRDMLVGGRSLFGVAGLMPLRAHATMSRDVQSRWILGK